MKKVTLVQTGLWLKGADHTKSIVFEDEQDAWRYCLRYYGIKNLDTVNRQKTKNFRGVFRTSKRWVLLTTVKFKPAKCRKEKETMRLIDGDRLKGRIDDCFGGGSNIALLIHKQIDDFEISTKSPEEVERVIKYFRGYREQGKAVVDLICYLFDMPQDTWRDEDFQERKNAT